MSDLWPFFRPLASRSRRSAACQCAGSSSACSARSQRTTGPLARPTSTWSAARPSRTAASLASLDSGSVCQAVPLIWLLFANRSGHFELRKQIPRKPTHIFTYGPFSKLHWLNNLIPTVSRGPLPTHRINNSSNSACNWSKKSGRNSLKNSISCQ